MYKIPDKFKIIKNPKIASKFLRKLKWKDGLNCFNCGCTENIFKHAKDKEGIYRYFCNNCGKTFSDTTNTVFHKSKIPLWKWIYMLILLFESTGSISSAEVSRNINTTYKTAFYMMKKMRTYFRYDNLDKILKGIVEADEAWFSKKDNQTILLGTVEREGSVKFYPVIDRSEWSLCYPIEKYVQKGSIICTDAFISYASLKIDYIHHYVNHSIKQWTKNHIHTNTIEGVWGMLKGILRTIHHGVSKKYLLDYCNLFSFMYSNRKLPLNLKFTLFFQKLLNPRYCIF